MNLSLLQHLKSVARNLAHQSGCRFGPWHDIHAINHRLGEAAFMALASKSIFNLLWPRDSASDPGIPGRRITSHDHQKNRVRHMETDNPYQAPGSKQSAPLLSGLQDGERAALLNGFIFQNTPYYEKRYPAFFQGKVLLGFNWAAALLTIPWLAYRKMYSVLFVYFIMFFLAGLVLAAISHGLGLSISSFRILNYLLIFAIKLTAGFYANYLYLSGATRKTESLMNRITGPEELMTRLSDAGGTSGLACTLVVVLSAVAQIMFHRM